MTSDDEQYHAAVKLVRERKTVSTRVLQHRLALKYDVASDFIEKMERENIITAPNAQGKRRVINPIKKPKPKYTDAQLLSSG